MRILQLAPIWETVPPPGYGGTETVVSVLTEELVKRGHKVTLAASGDSRTSAELMSVFPTSLRSSGYWRSALQYSLVHVAKALSRAGEFDIVHNHSGPPSELAMGLSSMVSVPMLTTMHNNLDSETEFIWRNYCGWYNSISAQQERILPRLPRARYAGYIHNAIDVDSFPFTNRKDDYFLYLGRMTPDKGAHLAIEAVRRFGGRILLAGKVAAPDEQAYQKEVIEPLLDGVTATFLGEADATLKRRLYMNARALLMPLCWDEPFGLVMIEAMACGTPVIAFSQGAAPEIIRHGQTGFLVSDLDDMVQAMHHVEEISPLQCRIHVEDCFSPGALADSYLALYQRMLAEHDWE